MNIRWYSKVAIPTNYKFRRRIFGKWIIGTTILVGGVFIAHEVYTTGDRVSIYPSLGDMDKKGQASFIYLDEAKVNLGNLKQKKENIIGHWLSWLQTYSDNPWVLLKLAQSQDPHDHYLGIKALTDRHGWTDSDYRHIAQAADYHTLVSLARMPYSDLRFFLPALPIPYKASQMSASDACHALLAALPPTSMDECIQYFTSLALLREQDKIVVAAEKGSMLSYGEYTDPQAYCKRLRSPPEDVMDMLYLQALLSHSSLESHCSEIVQNGGLLVLQRLQQKWHDNEQMQCILGRIIANLSNHKNLHQSLYKTGWVTVLATWIKSPCLELSMHATKSLANMDREISPVNYEEGIYLVYPQYRSRLEVCADIVFVHGLLGGPFKTWRQQDKENQFEEAERTRFEKTTDIFFSYNNKYTYCWPKDWLTKDFPKVRILTVEYDTHLSNWAPKCPLESHKHSLFFRSEQLLNKLKAAGLGQRPIIWVSHSMGGILVKQMLINCLDDSQLSNIVHQTKGIVFYSVPHRGSAIAAYSSQAKYLLLPSVEVKELTQDSPQLLELHQKFLQLVRAYHIPCLSFGETQKTSLGLNLKITLVSPKSSDPDIGEFYEVPVNHLDICKPASQSSHLYTLLVEFLHHLVPQAQADAPRLEFDTGVY